MTPANELHRLKELSGLDLKTIIYTELVSKVIVDGHNKGVYAYNVSGIENLSLYMSKEGEVMMALEELAKEGRIIVQKNGVIVLGEYDKKGKLSLFENSAKAGFIKQAEKTLKDAIWSYYNISSRTATESEEWADILDRTLVKARTGKTFSELEVTDIFTILFKMYTGGMEQNFTVKEREMFQALCRRYGTEVGLAIFIEGVLNSDEYITEEPTVEVICSKKVAAKIASFVNSGIKEERKEDSGTITKFS